MLSYIFVFMILISVVCSVVLDTTTAVSQSVMDGASSAVELLISLCGMICLWSGVMEIARQSKLTEKLSNLLSPLLSRLYPDIDKSSKAFSYICMNISANLLGIGNAATPLGLSAMRHMQDDAKTDVATDSMVTFVVMNTASIQLIPTTVAAMRSALGSNSPFDVIFCVWVASAVALAVGLTVSKICCKFGRKQWTL